MPDFSVIGETVVFVPGAIEKAIQQYGLPDDQAEVNAVCERAMTADPDLVKVKQAEMDRLDAAELESLFPCPDCARVGVGKA